MHQLSASFFGKAMAPADGSQSQRFNEVGALLAICRRMELLLLNVVRGMQGC